MGRDDYLLHGNMQYIIVTVIEFPCVHWKIRTAATDVYVAEALNLNSFGWSPLPYAA